MRSILFVESGTSGGGSFESLYQHLRVINRDRFRPVVVYLNENRFIEPTQQMDIPVYVFTDWVYSEHAPRAVRRLLRSIAWRVDKHLPTCYLEFVRLAQRHLICALERIVRKEKIDLIHLNDQINRDLFGLFVARRAGVACVSHLRSMRGDCFGRLRADYANRYVSAYMANSRATKSYWEGRGIDPEKIHVIYNAVPQAKIEPLDIRRIWKIDKRIRWLVGCVGNFNPVKGHDFLLKAFSLFVQSHPDAALLLVGDGPLRQALVQHALALGLQDMVFFVGHDPRAREIIAGLDLLVIPSQNEAFGRVLLEAMQARTPVIATRVGGIPEIIRHEDNGLLVSYGDEEELSRALKRLVSDGELRSRLIENGHCVVKERFSVEHYASEIAGIYEQVLGS